ncbi:DUF3006 domain-containing protein [Brochothrix campestris]|nr:DUF3006 domain-containing protein [Brochothrix campestris]
MMKTGIIDRFEGKYAVIEFADEMQDMLKKELPSGIKVGDVLVFEAGDIRINREARRKLENEIEQLADEII